jgi:hypothetical protein
MNANLTAGTNVAKDFDKQEIQRFRNYMHSQVESYKIMAAFILEHSLPDTAGTSVLIPVVFENEKDTAFRNIDLSPLAIRYIDVGGSLYQSEALLVIERELASFREFFESFKKENIDQEVQKIVDAQISNIRGYKDLNAGVSDAVFSFLVRYLSEQPAKMEAVVETLLNQFKADTVFSVVESETQPLASFKNVINVSLPVIEVEYYNGIPLDREVARIMNTGLETVRSEWKRVDAARKLDLLNRRQSQYQKNIEVLRSVDYGIKTSELSDAVEWGIRQHQISHGLFTSLIKSCTLDTDVLPESRIANSNVSVIDISPLGVSVKSFNGMFYDATLVSGVENMADTLTPKLVEQLRSQTVKTVQRQMNILRNNAAEWVETRYGITTRLALTTAEFTDWVKSTWAKMHSKEYQKVDAEGVMYLNYMIRDFRLDEELLYELSRAVESDNELFEALMRDFNNCALTGSGRWIVEGVTSEDRIYNAARTVAKYINDVFPMLLNTHVDIKFIEKESINWGPVLAIQIGVGLIPGVGLAADLVIDTCIEVAACFIEKELKQEEYMAKIVELINTEEQDLLYIINKPVYGGIK